MPKDNVSEVCTSFTASIYCQKEVINQIAHGTFLLLSIDFILNNQSFNSSFD